MGESLLYYSHYLDVKILHRRTTSSITNKLRKLFCRYNAPETLVIDNGPQVVQNKTFDALTKEFSFNHRKFTPYHPEVNGEKWQIALQN